MREPLAFSTLLLEAIRLTGKRRLHFVYLMLFGALALASYFVMQMSTSGLELPEDNLATLLTWTRENLPLLVSLTLLTLGFSFLQALLRGPLLLTLEETILGEKSPHTRPTLSLTILGKGAMKSLLFEFLYGVAILILSMVALLPVLLAQMYNPGALPSLLELSLLFVLTLIAFLFFIKEYALFYSLLGGTTLRSSIDLSYTLFRKNIGVSLLFGALLLGLSFIFTFLLDSAIITSAALVHNELFPAVFFVFVLSGAFALFENTVRLLFFHSLAASEKPKVKAEKALSSESISETPA